VDVDTPKVVWAYLFELEFEGNSELGG